MSAAIVVISSLMLVMLCYPAHQLAFVTQLTAMFNLLTEIEHTHIMQYIAIYVPNKIAML